MDHLTFELKTATITNPYLLTIGLVNEKAKVAFAVTQKEDFTFVLRLNKHRSVMGDTSETIIPELKKTGMLYLNNKVKEFSEEKKAWEEFLKYVKPFSSEFYTKNGINILEKVVSIVETRISHLENMTLQKIFNDRYVYLGFDATIVKTIGLPGFVPEELDEAVVWVQGEEKWNTIKNFIDTYPLMVKQPAQVLKKVPLLTIFTDYKK
jgi:hypothetical protein